MTPVGTDSEVGDTVSMPVGLAENPRGVVFQCGHCEWYGIPDEAKAPCRNHNPKLYGREVRREWCCNLFDRDDMRIVVR